MTVSASVKDGKTLLTIGNLSCTEAIEIALEGVGTMIPATAEARLLYAEDIHAHNTFEAPDTVKPVQLSLDLTKPIVVPKAGILAIRF